MTNTNLTTTTTNTIVSGLSDFVEIKDEQLENGCIIYNRRFTDKGREYLLEKYKETH